jgi:hypothetical protein
MDNVFQLHKETKSEKTYEFYTLIGKHKFLDNNKNPRLDTENDDTFAKKIIGTNSTKYYIKTGTYGKIYNPIGLFSEGTANKFMSKIGKKAWQFKEVNSKIFDMYVNFLKTKNTAWLTNAERELN